MPQYASLSHAECSAIHILREMANDTARKQVKREIFARAKSAFGIPATTKLVVETDILNSAAGILKSKDTRETFELNPATGKWIHATNGAATGQRWFLLPADNLRDAIAEALDNEDANGNDIVSQPGEPAGSVQHPKDETIRMGQDGGIWLLLAADAYEAPESSHEETDDDGEPY